MFIPTLNGCHDSEKDNKLTLPEVVENQKQYFIILLPANKREAPCAQLTSMSAKLCRRKLIKSRLQATN